MSNLSRLTPIRDVKDLTAKVVNGELNNIVNTWNSHNNGNAGWDTVRCGIASFKTGSLILNNVSSANDTTIQAGNASAAVTYTLPTAAPAANGYLLASTTGGVMSWTNSLGNVTTGTISSGNITAGTVSVSHLIGTTGTPTFSINTTGLGTNGTASVAGTDASGTITLNTSNADAPAANSDIITITFNAGYGSAPRVMIMPSNDSAAALAYGIVRCRQADTTTALFKLRSGTTSLPVTTTATYTFNYIVIQ